MYTQNQKYHCFLTTFRLVFLSVCFSLISACSEESTQLENDSKPVAEVQPPVSTDTPAVKISAWQGEAQGFQTELAPSLEQTSFAILLGSVLADFYFYTNLSDRVDDLRHVNNPEQHLSFIATSLPGALTNQTQQRFSAIATKIEAEFADRIKENLDYFAKPETISTLLDTSDENTQARREEARKLAATDAPFKRIVEPGPFNRKDYVQAASALWRLAGDAFASAVSAEGSVVDIAKLDQAQAYNWAVEELRPRWVSFCDAQRDIVKPVKKGVFDMRDKAYARETGETVTITATHFYALAAQMQKMAESLPENDEEICKK